MSDKILSSEELKALLAMAAEGSGHPAASPPAGSLRPPRLLEPLYREHPQTIALFLAALRPETAAPVFTRLEYAEQIDISHRIARFEATGTAVREVPRIVSILSTALEGYLSIDPAHDIARDFAGKPGPRLLASLLEHCPYGTRRRIILELADHDPAIAADVRKYIYVFDDLFYFSDETVGKILHTADDDDLARAMHTTGENLLEKIYRILPEDRSRELRETLDWSGAVAISVIEEAQEQIVGRAIDLARRGIINP